LSNLPMTEPDAAHEPSTADAKPAFDVERADHCRRCRYCLHGISDDAPCPECGFHLRQTGPHSIIETNNLAAMWCIAIAALMMVVACAGFWPAALAIPLLGLTAVIYGIIENRRRWVLQLPRSRSIMVTNLIGILLFLGPLVLIALVALR
jgi:hypothetical protein